MALGGAIKMAILKTDNFEISTTKNNVYVKDITTGEMGYISNNILFKIANDEMFCSKVNELE